MSHEIKLWIKKLIATGLFLLIIYGMYVTSSIIILLLSAGFISLLIIPLVDKWKKYKIPEWLTIAVVYFIIILLATIVVGTIIPIIINYLSEMVKQIVHWANTAQDTYIRYGIHGFNLPNWLENGILYFFSEDNINATLDIIKQNAGSIQTFLTNQISSITSGGISVVSSVGTGITNIAFVGIATFFMILERHSIGQLFLDITPDHAEEYIKYIFKKIQEVCISWIKASLILSLSIFILTYIGLIIVEMIGGFKTDSNLSLALISGIMEFVPYIGPILSVIPALIIGLGISWEATMIILILYIIIQQTENNILVPYIMSKNLDISPLFVFVIMLFGATLGGILGIIVAVPIAGIIKVLYTDIIDRKKKRGRYAPIPVLEAENENPNLPHPLEKSKKIFEKAKKYIAKIKSSK